jgi:hypothetical protein
MSVERSFEKAAGDPLPVSGVQLPSEGINLALAKAAERHRSQLAKRGRVLRAFQACRQGPPQRVGSPCTSGYTATTDIRVPAWQRERPNSNDALRIMYIVISITDLSFNWFAHPNKHHGH